MPFTTPDLCDRYFETHHLQILDPLFRSFGANRAFCGRITTLKIFEDNRLIRSVLEEKVEDRVLVVDGGGSHRCALLDAELTRMACANGWSGIIVYGCIRNSVEIAQLPIGVYALHTHPLKSHKSTGGERDILITFAGVNFRCGHYLYADDDGIVVAEDQLT